ELGPVRQGIQARNRVRRAQQEVGVCDSGLVAVTGDPAVEGVVPVRGVVDDAAELPKGLELAAELPDVAPFGPGERVLVRKVAVVVAYHACRGRQAVDAVDGPGRAPLGVV